MRKLLNILVLGLMLCTSTYALSCNLQIEEVESFESSGFIEINLYNPDNKLVVVTDVLYYDSSRSLIRSYPVRKIAKPKSNTTFLHYTSENLLSKTQYYNVKC